MLESVSPAQSSNHTDFNCAVMIYCTKVQRRADGFYLTVFSSFSYEIYAGIMSVDDGISMYSIRNVNAGNRNSALSVALNS